MTPAWHWIERGVLAAILLSVGAMAAAVQAPAGHPGPAFAAPLDAAPVPPSVGSAGAESLYARLVAKAPFRVDRQPPPPAAPQPAIMSLAIEPRPALLLTAVAWGPRPAAVVEGLPGVEGSRLVVVGDSVGGLVVRHIGPAGVTIAARDTVWVLRLAGASR